MNASDIRHIVESLPRDKTVFHYFKDRYALLLLGAFVGRGKDVGAIRISPFGRLLEKPVVKDILATRGRRVVRREDLESWWPRRSEAYVLTLGIWGRHKGWNRTVDQMSRRGSNLVLQLNFSSKHDRAYRKLLAPGERRLFNHSAHPVNSSGRQTLAWARLDIDLERDEALIEEVQSDWIQGDLWRKSPLRADELRGASSGYTSLDELEVDDRKLDTYVNRILAPHRRLWEETILAAAIWFLREELGVRRIFYHSFESGLRLKGLEDEEWLPPRSLYTSLPRRFCFAETADLPAFLRDGGDRQVRFLLRRGNLKMFCLEL